MCVLVERRVGMARVPYSDYLPPHVLLFFKFFSITLLLFLYKGKGTLHLLYKSGKKQIKKKWGLVKNIMTLQ